MKLLQNRLVVRVGGGFMSIDEFMIQYSQMEFQKVELMMERGHFSINNFIDGQSPEVSPPKRDRKSLSRSPLRLTSP